MTRNQIAAPATLLVLFVLLAGIPLVAVGWLGWRLLEQDRALDVQRLGERLDNAAALAAGELNRSLTVWSDLLAPAAQGESVTVPADATLLAFDTEGSFVSRASACRITRQPHLRLLCRRPCLWTPRHRNSATAICRTRLFRIERLRRRRTGFFAPQRWCDSLASFESSRSPGRRLTYTAS